MKFKDVYKIIKDVPCSDEESCRLLYDFVMEFKPDICLELGCAWGKSACTVGAALHELRRGRLYSLDLKVIETFAPNVFENIKKCGLADYVFPSLSQASYTWQLMKLIESNTKNGVCEPLYDFVFLDGAHTWETDSSAYFLATKLLKPGGWILFDDVKWTISTSSHAKALPEFNQMPEDYRTISHVEKIVELLLKQSPEYGEIFQRNNWAWARKKAIGRDMSRCNQLNGLYFKNILRSKLRNMFIPHKG
ncbi:MAG: class I SAM-dependent methyltransferase [Kiritimatiellae bacterium]|nr:class I SAM-dependent methyltransferase [Kiritimatiellia bacterium]